VAALISYYVLLLTLTIALLSFPPFLTEKYFINLKRRFA
jgi:hypothetical protein